MKRYLAAAVTLLAVAITTIGGLLAQSNFTAPGGQNVPMQVQGCLNASGQAVACSTGTAGTAGFPPGATPITASATGTTAAVTATLAAVAGKTTYICGFSITADATAGTSVAASITGTITGTLNYVQGVGALTTPSAPLAMPFVPCLPASGLNTAIAVNSGAAGAGGIAAVSAWGYQQ